jgi:hypothetical protein
MPYVTSGRFKGFLNPDGIASSSTPTFTTFNLNNDDMGIAYQITMPEAATITRVMLYCTAASALTDPATVRLEGINLTNGQPDNTSLSGAAVNIPNTAGFLTITLTTPYSASAGSTFYIVIRLANQNSGSQTFSITRRYTTSTYSPLVLTRASGAGTFTKLTTTNGFPQAIVGSSTKWYGWSCPVAAHASGAVQANPIYVGFYFQTPASFPELLLKSVYCGVQMTANELTDFVIFNSAGTTLYSSVYDNDQFASSTSTRMNEFIVANGIWITPSTKYYVMFRSTTAAANKNIFRHLVDGPAVVSDFTNGMQWGVSRYTSGTFVDDGTAIPAAALEICQMRYFQTGGTPIYSIPSSFNQLSG